MSKVRMKRELRKAEVTAVCVRGGFTLVSWNETLYGTQTLDFVDYSDLGRNF
jgi:hypothetical protein